MRKLTKKRARLYGLLLFLAGLSAATTLTLFALRDNLSYFRTPTELVHGTYPEHGTDRGVRLGGLVEKNSLKRQGNTITFSVTDLKNTLAVKYTGSVPDLFREGQGVVAEGHMDKEGVFQATLLLAKHDEKYVPPEVKRALAP